MDKDTSKKEQTKRVRSSDIKKNTKKIKTKTTTKTVTTKAVENKGGKKIKFRDKHPRAATAIKISIIAIILLVIIGAGILVGAFYGVFGSELKIEEKDLVIKLENSTVYDKDGNVIANLSDGTKRKIVSLSEVSEYLPKAFVAIEDERFYEHSGVDILRTGKAVLTYLANGGSSSFGGSTITQQLVKNITNEKDNSSIAGAIRKVKEMSKAIQVEQYLSKDEILELYLNIIFIGGDDINGVALGSVYYFDKDVKDLSIAESAFLAGINHMPNNYSPFAEDEDGKEYEKIAKRTKTVIGKMKELEYITQEEYDEAIKEVDNKLAFKRGEEANVTVDISYHTEAALEQILDQIMEETDMSKEMAEIHLYSSGLKIYTTQDTEVQNRLEEELANEKKYMTIGKYRDPKTKEVIEQRAMASMVIINNLTGEVVASGTGIGEDRVKTKIGYFNTPTRMYKSTGSSMKPISVIAPGIEAGVITGATVYYDAATSFGGGTYNPHNYYKGYRGLMNIRSATEISANIPFVKALANLGVDTSVEFCNSVGLTQIEGDEGLSLGLGGLTHGVSVYQMAAAYSAIANDGVYKEPTFYTKVTDKEGNVLYEPKQEEKTVLTEQSAYIVKNILQQPVKGGSGTATYCAIPGMDVAAKTGTTNDDFDRWRCGFTPYYTAACWYGYERNAEVDFSGNPAGKIWDAVMTDIHKDLENAKFEEPEGIKKVSICRESGKKSIEGCTNAYTELFTADTVPGNCDGHSKMVVCRDSGMLPNEFCPVHEERIYAYMPEKERNASWSSKLTIKNPDGTEVPMAVAPTERCTMHTQPVACTHTWGEWMTQPQNANAEERRCTTCGNIEYREKPKPVTNTVTNTTTHTCSFTTYTVTKAATCTEEGTETATCTVTGCGKKNTRTIKVKGHTSTTNASGDTVCSVCKATLKAHECKWGEPVVVDATCDKEGSKTYKCTVTGCGKTKVDKISAKGHTNGAAAANGEVKCTVCGTVIVAGKDPEPPPSEGGGSNPGEGAGDGSPSGQSEG